MSKDKCPYCGAKAVDDYLTYACGTTGIIEGSEERGVKCYETQLAHQTALLCQALEAAEGLLLSDNADPLEVVGKNPNTGHPLNVKGMARYKAQALLPELRKATKGK